jgi:bifunctional ADP-heptose synthase (sugar kinase/adenylyltransferase)
MRPEQLDGILAHFPHLRICVVGDLFLDKYLDIDPSLAETSLETGLEAHQVVRVRCYPGAAGTVASNLTALGIGHVAILTLLGDDGEGYDLRQALQRAGIDDAWLRAVPSFQTPTYTKPLLQESGGRVRELSRLDFKNRGLLARGAEQWVVERLDAAVSAFDALIIADQVQERSAGVITDRVRGHLSELAQVHPECVLTADSRCRIGEFRNVIIKPNRSEVLAALAGGEPAVLPNDEASLARQLARRCSRPVYLTLGAEGLLVADQDRTVRVATYNVSGDIDIVGAGDSTMAGITAALCSGATLRQAGLIGCLVSSITIQQIGVTGSASRDQVKRRFSEYLAQYPSEIDQSDIF